MCHGLFDRFDAGLSDSLCKHLSTKILFIYAIAGITVLLFRLVILLISDVFNKSVK